MLRRRFFGLIPAAVLTPLAANKAVVENNEIFIDPRCVDLMLLIKSKIAIFKNVFPNGCKGTLQNLQILLDKGWSTHDVEKLHVPFSGKLVEADGSQHWYYEGKRHRVDGPAVIKADGSQHWYCEGKQHREDGPAAIEANGSQYWYHYGEFHRLDGPAIIWANGTQLWYHYGKLHREDGPAIIFANGRQEWYYKSERHREDGPAIIEADGSQEWYYHGKLTSEPKHS